jgi:predicted amidohydrolase YtcJ
MDPANPAATAVAIRDGRFVGIGNAGDMARFRGPATRVIDAGGRSVIPGLHDSHSHVIRGGRLYNMELRWDGVPSLSIALRMLKEQVARTPAPQWVRVIGGWTEFQFAERRMPTLDELNEIGGETPIFILNLYRLAMLNRAALRAVGYTKDTPAPPGSIMERDNLGNPTGLLLAKPYATLVKGPSLSPVDLVNSTRLYLRELNRLGITSISDAGGGTQNYPEDYRVYADLASRGELTIRTSYSLTTQHPQHELEDYERWMKLTSPDVGDDMYKMAGAGELIAYTGYDFENFSEPAPTAPPETAGIIKPILSHLIRNRWPFRLHATYDEAIGRFLTIIEEIDRETPLNGLRWFFDHAETVSQESIERIARLHGGIAVQDRLAFQGEYFSERYGVAKAANAPPLRQMIDAGLPVGAGTDATRVSSYNPWLSLHWLHTGETLGGLAMNGVRNRLPREEALRLYTTGSAWFSGDTGSKGAIAVGQLADLAIISADYFRVPAPEIKNITSVCTIVGGKIVYADSDFSDLAPARLPVSPSWSPVAVYDGIYRGNEPVTAFSRIGHAGHAHGGISKLLGGSGLSLDLCCFD